MRVTRRNSNRYNCAQQRKRHHIRSQTKHDDVMKWKHFLRHWSFVRGIHRSPVNSPHNGQWRGALIFSFIYAQTNGWANLWDTGDLRRHRAHYDITVMLIEISQTTYKCKRHAITWTNDDPVHWRILYFGPEHETLKHWFKGKYDPCQTATWNAFSLDSIFVLSCNSNGG